MIWFFFLIFFLNFFLSDLICDPIRDLIQSDPDFVDAVQITQGGFSVNCDLYCLSLFHSTEYLLNLTDKKI